MKIIIPLTLNHCITQAMRDCGDRFPAAMLISLSASKLEEMTPSMGLPPKCVAESARFGRLAFHLSLNVGDKEVLVPCVVNVIPGDSENVWVGSRSEV